MKNRNVNQHLRILLVPVVRRLTALNNLWTRALVDEISLTKPFVTQDVDQYSEPTNHTDRDYLRLVVVSLDQLIDPDSPPFRTSYKIFLSCPIKSSFVADPLHLTLTFFLVDFSAPCHAVLSFVNVISIAHFAHLTSLSFTSLLFTQIVHPRPPLK